MISDTKQHSSDNERSEQNLKGTSMDSDKVTATSRVYLIFYISFGLIFLAVIGLTVMIFSMNETLKKQQEILIKVPPELHPQIIEAFQHSADTAKEEAVGIHRIVSDGIKADIKKQFELQEGLLQKLRFTPNPGQLA